MAGAKDCSDYAYLKVDFDNSCYARNIKRLFRHKNSASQNFRKIAHHGLQPTAIKKIKILKRRFREFNLNLYF